MLIFPAIDLKDGKVVRLYKGDFATVHQVADDPAATARAFRAAGARYLHMVDLDGAKDGVRRNSAMVRAAAETGLLVELGGGLRSMADLEAVFDLGIWRAVIGSAAVSDPDFVRRALAAYGPERIAVGIDAKEGMVATEGWLDTSSVGYLDLAKEMERAGVKTIIFTDISRDGMLGGLNLEQLAALENAVSCNIIASGGVRDLRDIEACGRLGLHGVICGKARAHFVSG